MRCSIYCSDEWIRKEKSKDPTKRNSSCSAKKERLPGKEKIMDDLEKYIEKRKNQSEAFSVQFEEGYENFKIGVLLRRAREEAGITQEELAGILKTKKSAISRIENHSEDIRLSTLKSYVKAIGRKLQLIIS